MMAEANEATIKAMRDESIVECVKHLNSKGHTAATIILALNDLHQKLVVAEGFNKSDPLWAVLNAVTWALNNGPAIAQISASAVEYAYFAVPDGEDWPRRTDFPDDSDRFRQAVEDYANTVPRVPSESGVFA
jgi:hypothetical protein